MFDIIKRALSAKWREASGKATSMGLGGDMKGDGFQNGGALIIDKNGKQLYEYVQEDAAEHISAEEIYKALNIKPWTACIYLIFQIRIDIFK